MSKRLGRTIVCCAHATIESGYANTQTSGARKRTVDVILRCRATLFFPRLALLTHALPPEPDSRWAASADEDLLILVQNSGASPIELLHARVHP